MVEIFRNMVIVILKKWVSKMKTTLISMIGTGMYVEKDSGYRTINI